MELACHEVGFRSMENIETQSHALRVLAHDMRVSASQTDHSWFANKMLDSAIDLEVQANRIESRDVYF
jgi:hypothetical protein